MKIRISADSACDLTPELLKRYDIQITPLTVTAGKLTGLDGVTINREDLYRHVDAGGELPSTSAVNPADYAERFAAWRKEFDAVIHISLGSKISSCYQNARLAASEFEQVYVVDSQNLSSGFGHVVVEAAIMAEKGMEPAEIVSKLENLVPRVRASFILSRLDYMKKGGRCTAVELLGANLLKLMPQIAVTDGAMGVVKKYRGSFEKCLKGYVQDLLKDREDLVLDRVFITHSGVPEGIVPMVEAEIRKYADFREIIETNAGCTISSHCGPGTLGVLFITR